jgi:hypothetical protein
MDTGDVVSSTIAAISLIATAILAYRQTRLQVKLTAIEQTRQRQELRMSRSPLDLGGASMTDPMVRR